VTLVVFAALAGALLAGRRRLADLWPPSVMVVLLLVFGTYLTVNAAWSNDRLEAYGKVLFFFTAVGLTHLVVAGIREAASEPLKQIGRVLLVAFAIGTLFLLVEVWLGQPIRRGLFSSLPLLRLDSKHLKIVDGNVVAIFGYTLNRSIAALAVVLWPILLLVRALLPAGWVAPVAIGLAGLTTVAVFTSEHETSKLSLMFAGIAFAGMVVAPVLMRRAILAGWVTATLLVVPIAGLAFLGDLHKTSAIPETGRHRIILWGYTAEKVLAAPFFGTGVASTRGIDQQVAPSAARPENATYALRPGRHSHNIFIQAWSELGAVGAALLCGVGLVALYQLGRIAGDAAPYVQASVVSAVIIGCFSWGMWQTWFMAFYAVWAALLILAIEVARRPNRSWD
jgi:hypothetical protein